MDYPEHEKLKKAKDGMQTIREFVEWLHSEKEFVWAKFHDGHNLPFPVNPNTFDLLAEYFEIDQGKLEEERQRMLTGLQNK